MVLTSAQDFGAFSYKHLSIPGGSTYSGGYITSTSVLIVDPTDQGLELIELLH